jgi:hypothetical protein
LVTPARLVERPQAAPFPRVSAALLLQLVFLLGVTGLADDKAAAGHVLKGASRASKKSARPQSSFEPSVAGAGLSSTRQAWQLT